MNNIELIKEVVEEIGLRPRFDEDGDLVVRYQLKTIFLFADEESSFVSMAMPRIYKVKEGEEALADAGARNFYLEVREHNESAIAFYRNLGFEKNGERGGYYSDGENAVLMTRPL